MKKVSGGQGISLLIGLLTIILLSASVVWAKPTTPEQAKAVVMNWLGKEASPMRAPLGGQIREVRTFTDSTGNAAYYVVFLNPTGLVFLPAEDLVEPIIGFVSDATSYDPSPVNPLGALVSKDIPSRVLQARATAAKALEKGLALAPETPEGSAQHKWSSLTAAPSLDAQSSGLPAISDIRVPPFIQSHWSQTTVDDTNSPGSTACYNYYTPPFSAGTYSNYPCGCVATALGQLMRYWKFPTVGVGSNPYTITVDGTAIDYNLRGGDGYGGSYDWANMVLSPLASGVNLAQQQAIGNLLYDAGLSVNMSYTASESGASVLGKSALINTFGYSNAKNGAVGSGTTDNIPSVNRNAMINPNLHAQYPVLLGIYGSSGGHAIVCDGYGYNDQSMYHHLNLGWSGQDDAWYNLPIIYTTSYQFNSIGDVVYNVYTTGSGEIIAGRVTDDNGNPVSGATVTATSGNTTYHALAPTTSSGVYAIPKVPSNTTYTVTASKPEITFTPNIVSTGTSQDDSITTGNLWQVDFTVPNGLNAALDNFLLKFTTSGNAKWFAQSNYWHYGGSAAQSGPIAYGQSTSLQTNVSGPGTLSFYWGASSMVRFTQVNNIVTLYLDGVAQDSIGGAVLWTRKTLKIPKGSHTVTWTYSKSGSSSVNFGEDCAWVDKVSYTHSVMGVVSALLLSN